MRGTGRSLRCARRALERLPLLFRVRESGVTIGTICGGEWVAGGREGPQFGRVMIVDGENLRRWKVDGPRPGLGALSHFGWSEERPAVHSLKLVARSGGASLQGCLHEKRIKGRRWDKLRRMNHIG